MTRVMCFAFNCVNYINNECTKNIIKMNNKKSCNVNCSTYLRESLECGIKNYLDKEYLDILTNNLNYKGDIDHKIICNCEECTYNFANICTSTDINVYGEGAEYFLNALCKTFLKKL